MKSLVTIPIKDAIAMNLDLQSIRRELIFNYRINNFNVQYFKSIMFKSKYNKLTEQEKYKFCALLCRARSNEVKKYIEE